MFSILKKYNEIITKTKVILYEFEDDQVRIKIDIELADESMLAIKEYKFSNNKRKYAYHWMDSKKTLKIRWDNAPHWKTVSTFPHHKHIDTVENIQLSTETDLESVLDYIKKDLILRKYQ